MEGFLQLPGFFFHPNGSMGEGHQELAAHLGPESRCMPMREPPTLASQNYPREHPADIAPQTAFLRASNAVEIPSGHTDFLRQQSRQPVAIHR